MDAPRYAWLAAVLVLAPAAGCAQPNYTAAERYDHGLVVCLSGSGHMMNEVRNIRRGLYDGGVACAIETFAWSAFMLDLTTVEEKQALAADLARRIEQYLDTHPGRPVHLVGVSSGTGLLVWGLEDLRPGCRVTTAILLASSLSRAYDLTDALEHLDGAAYNFHSPLDLVSGASVAIRTVDGRHDVAAGMAGFQVPDDLDDRGRAVYRARLVQIQWTPADVLTGNVGDHLGATRPAYVRQHIAPLITTPCPEPPPLDTPPTPDTPPPPEPPP